MTTDDAFADLPPVARRFLRYVQIDTQSDRDSGATPSTEKQKDLSRLLAAELRDLGIDGAEMDDKGYVYAHMAARGENARSAPTVALVAHVDTSPDEPGGPVRPMVHLAYDGSKLTLPGAPDVHLDPARSPALLEHIGHDLITSDGSTLLGSDDKAGVAIAMQAVEDLLADPAASHPPLSVCFTVDEEIGRGVDALDLERLGAEVAYTIDGGSVGDIDTATFHAAEAILEIEGVMVHPGTAKGIMVNAATTLFEILSSLPANETPETTDGEEGYFCPFSVEADIAKARARVLLRDFTEEGMDRRRGLLTALVEAARWRHPQAQIGLELVENYKNMHQYILTTDARAIEFALAAAREQGLAVEEKAVRGGTDGCRLSELGLPTPNLFTGGHDYHSRFEWNTVQNLETSLRYVKGLLGYWARHGANPKATLEGAGG